jgi:hypothetical protein
VITFDAKAGNNMDEPELLQESETLVAEGRHPSRIVLRKVKEKTYATHVEVLPAEGEPYFILGRYFFSQPEAEADFQKRIVELKSIGSGDI